MEMINMANGGCFTVPTFCFTVPTVNPIVSRHFSEASSYIPTLLEEINVKQIYAPLFKGKQDLVFLDIGANIGLVSIYAADACKRIVAIEPAPATFEVLEAMTLWLPNIEPVCAALAPVDGPCEFFQNEQNTTASSTVNTYGAMIEVPGLTLTSILSQNQLEHVDVCKIDAEGAEWESLNKEQLTAAKDIIDCYWIEAHSIPRMPWDAIMETLMVRLRLVGYHNQEIDGMRLLARK